MRDEHQRVDQRPGVIVGRAVELKDHLQHAPGFAFCNAQQFRGDPGEITRVAPELHERLAFGLCEAQTEASHAVEQNHREHEIGGGHICLIDRLAPPARVPAPGLPYKAAHLGVHESDFYVCFESLAETP
jgi:hypothetical protein